MASLFNTKISDTYVGLIKTLDTTAITATLKELSDGNGNATGLFINTSGDFKVTATLEWGSLKDTGTGITITNFVDSTATLASNKNDTTVPTSKAVSDYVDTQVGASDLDFSGDSGTGAVILASETFAVTGTTNQIETTASGTGLALSLPSTVHRDLQGNVTGNLTGDVTGNVTGNVTGDLTGDSDGTHTGAVVGNVTGNVTGDLTGTVTATSSLADGVTATSQAVADDSTKVATTAFVQDVVGTIPAGLVFQGTWNANTNTPTLASGTGTTGHFYIVSVAGTTDLDGVTDWAVGDWAVFVEQGATDQWEKVDNSSVLDGNGTGGKISKWAGSGNSVTLTDSVITEDDSKIGIGTSSPNRTLHVNSPSSNFVAEFESGTDKASILIQDDDTLNYIHSKDGFLSLGGQSSLDSNNLNINSSSGNIGIGISSGMTYPLTIQAGSGNNSYVHFVNTTTGTAFNDGFQVGVADGSSDGYLLLRESANMRFYTAGSEKMRITSSGDVQARRTRSNTAGEVALSLQPTDSTIHYGFRIDSTTNSFNLDRVDSAGQLLRVDSSGNTTFAGDVSLGDNKKIKLGAGNDLELYSDGTDGYVVASVDDLVLRSSDDIFIEVNSGANSIIAKGGGAVELYHNNSKKLETTSSGVTVTGGIVFGDNHFIGNGSGDDLSIQSSTGEDIVLDASGDIVLDADDGDIRLKDGGVEFVTFNSSTGSTFSGTVLIDGVSNYTGLEVKGTGASRPAVNLSNATTGILGQVYATESSALVFATTTSGTTALTLDSSQNATFSGTIDSGTITSTGVVKAATTFQSTSGSMKFFVPNVGEALEIAQNTGNATFAGSLDVGNFTFSGSGIVADAGMTLQTGGGSVNAITLASGGNATFAGDIGLGGTGLYTASHSLNIDGTGLAIKNDTNGSSNNWSTIKNTDTGSNSNLVFNSGLGTALTLNHDKSATFSGEITVNDDLNAATKIVIGESASPELRLKKTNAGGAKVSFYNDNSQTAYIQLDSSEDVVYYGGANVNQIFYAGGSERMRIGSDGRVGINESSPDALLDIELTDTNTYDATVNNQATIIAQTFNTSNVNNQTSIISLRTTGYAGSTTGIVNIGAVQLGNASSADFIVQTRNAGTYGERMRITSDGSILQQGPQGGGDNTQYTWQYGNDSNFKLDLKQNVGGGIVKHIFDLTNNGTSYANNLVLDRGNVAIGTDSPVVPFHIVGTAVNNPSNGSGGYEVMQVFDDTSFATGVGGGIGFGGNFTSSNSTIFSEIRGLKENSTDGNYAGALSFSTRENGGNITEAMRIKSDGKITAPEEATFMDIKYSSFSSGSLDTTGVTVGTITGGGNGSSAIVEFTGSGGVDGLVDVVFSCHNDSGNWSAYKNSRQTAKKVDVDVSGTGTGTLTFTFKSLSGSQGYTPRLMRKGGPSALVTF